MMRLGPIFRCAVYGCLLLRAGAQKGPASAREQDAYGLTLPVDEVVITFHAADAHGLPVNDLSVNEIGLLDDGKGPGKILAFDSIVERPLRAGILIDSSESMFSEFPRIRGIATAYARTLFRQKSDRAFVMDFGYSSHFVQPWTSDPAALSQSVSAVKMGERNPIGGTALFDTIFRACYHGFKDVDRTTSGNFIMLFSDGEDNASHTSLEAALDACQQSNTVIYAFRPSVVGDGISTLAKLASKSGGRLFTAVSDETAVFDDLRVIESDLRNEYRLVYRPSSLKHDGSFHQIVIEPPDRVAAIQVRTGYYAPGH